MMKKKKLAFVFFAFVVILAGCMGGATKYQISGNVVGLDSGKVFHVKIESGKPIVFDTANVAKGKFVFTGQVEGLPEIHYLRLGDREYFAVHFLEHGKIKVEANRDSLQAAIVSGTPQNNIFTTYKDELNVLMKNMNKYRQDYSQAMASGNQQDVDRARIDFEASEDNMTVFAKNFVREHNNSVVAPFIALSQLANQLDYQDLKPLVDTISPALNESIYMKELAQIVDTKAKTKIGSKAPDFTMNDPEGNPITLSSLFGNYLLIDFWAAWCGPCRKENPNVVAAYNLYKNKGFDIIGVSLDRDKNAWIKAIADDKLTWHHVSDLQYWQNEVAQLYGVRSIPHSLLLDKNGIIIAKDLRGDALEQKLKELMP